MEKLRREELYSLEKYSEIRGEFRQQVMAHKKNRRLAIGANATVYFEDRLTMQYQIQEILRAERIFQAGEIEQELAVYNELIPDGGNWKATFMLEFEDPAERRRRLAELLNIEDRVWVRLGDCEPVHAVADEDLERQTEAKTSAVHFLRFELSSEMIDAARRGAPLAAGIDHSHYRFEMQRVPEEIRRSLVGDLQ